MFESDLIVVCVFIVAVFAIGCGVAAYIKSELCNDTRETGGQLASIRNRLDQIEGIGDCCGTLPMSEEDIDYELKRKFGYVLVRNSNQVAEYQARNQNPRMFDTSMVINIHMSLDNNPVMVVSSKIGVDEDGDNGQEIATVIPMEAMKLLWMKSLYMSARYNWSEKR